MEQYIKMAEEFIKTGNIVVGIIVLIAAGIFFFFKSGIFDGIKYLIEKDFKDIAFAGTLLKDGTMNRETNEVLREHLERKAFRICYGFDTHSIKRIAIAKFYNLHSNFLSLKDLRNAKDLLSVSESGVTTNLTNYDFRLIKFIRFARYVFLVVFVFNCIGVVANMYIEETITLNNLYVVARALAIYVFALIILYFMDVPYESIKRVQRAISMKKLELEKSG